MELRISKFPVSKDVVLALYTYDESRDVYVRNLHIALRGNQWYIPSDNIVTLKMKPLVVDLSNGTKQLKSLCRKSVKNHLLVGSNHESDNIDFCQRITTSDLKLVLKFLKANCELSYLDTCISKRTKK